VERQFVAERPNQLWVADFTYVATFCDRCVFADARRLARKRFHEGGSGPRCPGASGSCSIGYPGANSSCDKGSQYLCIRYSERLAEHGIAASVGTTGDSYDNALAESIIGLFKTEVIWPRGPWRSLEAVEYATLEWVDWLTIDACSSPWVELPHQTGQAAGW
jgi:transposase InsO family protein